MDPSQAAGPLRGKISVCELGFVRYDTEKVICNWSVVDFDKWPKDVHEVKSPTFWHSGSTEWCMALSVEDGEWFLRFNLLSSNRAPSEEAVVKASLISSQGKEYKVFSPEAISLEAPKETEWVRVSDFFDREPNFKNVLQFQGEISIPSVISEPYRSVALRQESGNLSIDLGILLDSGAETDIVLVAGDTKLRAHRAVLYARSPVFASMLRQDAREDGTGDEDETGSEDESSSINIQDVDADTLREVLRYIYTDTAPHLKIMAHKLLVAADKYALLKLKKWCEMELSNQLTVDNAAGIAVVALTHNCSILKPAVITFIKKHVVSVLGTDSWAAAVESNPDIITKISRLTADKRLEKDV